MAKIHTQIRLERVARRLGKTKYSTCPKEREIEKLLEQNEQFNKDISATWSIMYNKGFVAGKDNSSSIFFQDFDFILATEKRRDKNNKRIEQLCVQLATTEEAILENKYNRNAGRASQSF